MSGEERRKKKEGRIKENQKKKIEKKKWKRQWKEIRGNEKEKGK